MDSVFRDILYGVSDSCTNSDGCRCPGHLYNFSFDYPSNDNVHKIEASVRYIVSKHNSETIHLSVHMVYGTSDDWDELKEIRQEIMNKHNIFVSPVTWNPTKKFRYDMFCFGFFPFFQRVDFTYSEEKERYNLTPDGFVFPFTPDGLVKAEQCRLSLLNSGKSFMAPSTYFTDYGLDTVCFKIKEITNGVENKFHQYSDDSNYDDSLLPGEFAKLVITDNGLDEDYFPCYNLICTKQIEKAEKVFGILKTRLNVSDYVFLRDYEYYRKERYSGLYFNKVAFSFDDEVIDKTSGHFDIFRIQKSYNI